MDKMLNRYFDKVVESEFNQQRMRSEQWRQKRTLFDSYMNLSPAERRRVSVSDMRGYQMQRIDDENVLLYSFEDNVVYNAKIDKQFNKIVVQSVNHELSDMEKRAIFDNPFGYEPVSPYRIRYQRAQVGDAQIVNIPGDLGASINEMKNAADAITGAAQQMGESINTFAQQSVSFHNDIDSLRNDLSVNVDPEETPLLWNDDNSMVYIRDETHKVKRGSQAYNDLVSAGRVERGRWMVKPEVQPVNVTNQIVQKMDVKPILEKLDEVIAVMNSFDIQVNLVNIYNAIAYVAQRINFLEDKDKGYPKMLELLEGVQTKLTNTNDGIKSLSDKYAEVATSIATGDDNLIQKIGDLVNQQKAVIQESNRYLQRIETRLQGIENKPDPPAIADIQALIPTQSEMRIDGLTEFMKAQYNDFLKQWLERNSFIQQFVSGELAKAYDEINKRLVESFNRFAPMFRNISNRIALMNMKLVTLGKVVEEEGKATRKQLLDGTNALGNQYEQGQAQTTKLIKDSTGAIVDQLADNQTKTGNLLTNGFTSMSSQLTDNQTQTNNLLTDVGNAVVDGHAQTGQLLTTMSNHFADTQLSREQLYQQLYQQNMRGIQNLMDAIWQSYEYFRNQPQIQPVIVLNDRQPESVNASFTPQAIDQVNRAAALIDAYESTDSNSTKESWESDDTRDDFIAFSSLLARNFNNPVFAQFANDLGFSRLFRAYRDRNEDPELMSFFIRVANSKDLTPDYLDYMKNKIKRFAVNVDQQFEQYLQNTYNTIKDMFITQGFNG